MLLDSQPSLCDKALQEAIYIQSHWGITPVQREGGRYRTTGDTLDSVTLEDPVALGNYRIAF